MSLNEKNLKNVYDFIKKMLIINNTANHKFNIIIKYVKYNNTVTTFKTDF